MPTSIQNNTQQEEKTDVNIVEKSSCKPTTWQREIGYVTETNSAENVTQAQKFAVNNKISKKCGLD